jgi:trk system potassium uptake protein
MNFVIIGCGRVGAQLAYSLVQHGHKVTIVDKDSAAFTNLPADFFGRTVEGEATYQDVLIRAGIENADGVAIVTNSDATNAVVGHIGQTFFKVRNVVVRNYDPLWQATLDSFHLNVVSSSSWGAQRIEDLLYNLNLTSQFSSNDQEAGVYELVVPDIWANQPLSKVIPEKDYSIVGLVRDGKVILPERNTTFVKGDRILLSTTQKGVDAIRKHLHIPQEKLS